MSCRRFASRTLLMAGLGSLGALAGVAPVSAQDSAQIMPTLRAPTAAFARSARLTAIPAAPSGTDEEARCQSWCSAFNPGEVVTEFIWAETDGGDQPDPEARLDITAAAAGLAGNRFATVRLTAVPVAVPPPEREVDLELVKQRMAPVLLQPVENGRIADRPQALRTPAAVLAQRTVAAKRAPSAERTRRNAATSGLAMLQTTTVVVQQRRIERGRMMHVLTMEGLEPGLSYEFAVRTRAMARPAANLCRIPVCPADMVATPPR